ncbi:MAG: hypothetical protein M3X11_07455 [Acidobacteriota bacterium]|nr:hypothetical protein [Acidobacteriota bacterium]
MNTMEDEAFDYQAYMRETPPDPAQIRRGIAARQQRLDAAIGRQPIRIDPDILQQFGQLTAEEQSAEQLINQALRQWLAADGIREMVRAEIQLAVRQSLSASQPSLESPPA